MRVAVVGATGRIGRLLCHALERRHHTALPISRAHGVDVLTGEGLLAALDGADAVVDVTNTTHTDEAAAVDFFRTSTHHLLAAEREARVTHHVVLSIVGVSRVRGNAHYAGKRAQEAAVTAGDIPFTIVPATQFHDFAEMVASWTEENGISLVPPLLVQPIAPADVADVLADVATRGPRGRHPDIAGPEVEDLVDMTRRTLIARGRTVELVPSWHTGIFGVEMAGDVLLPSAGAYTAPTSFDAWLSTITPARSTVLTT